MSIRSVYDVLEIEKTSIWDRIPEQNVYARLRNTAQHRQDHLAIRALQRGEADEVPRDLTYRQLIATITRTANLFSSLGVGPHDVVSILAYLVPEALCSFIGAMAVGIANPLNPYLDPLHLANVMRQTGTSVLVVSGEPLSPGFWSQLDAVRKQLPNLKAILRIGGTGAPPAGVRDLEEALAAQPEDRLMAETLPTRESVAALFHTGGTTGNPKIARLTHGGLLSVTYSANVVMVGEPSDVTFMGFPIFHAAGAIPLGLGRLIGGQTIVLLTPEGLRAPAVLRNYWALVERLGATVLSAVPTSLPAMLQSAENGNFDRSRVRFCIAGAATVPVDTAKRFLATLNIQVVEGYGLTEVHGSASFTPPEGECRYGSVGLRIPYLEVLIAEVSPDGEIRRPCSHDEIGHVLLRGPMVFPGYLNEASNRGVLLADGWMDSGDLGRLDAEGYLWLTGRAKDLIIRGGHNIDPLIIEQTLGYHPAVELAAAVGCPDRHAGELPVAFVRLRAGHEVTAEELREFCRSRIPERAAVPVEIFVLTTFPLTPVGKIFKPTLRKDAAHRIFTRELAKLTAVGITGRVEIVDDPRAGTLARIQVEDCGPLDQKAVAEHCRTLLGGYQMGHEVVFS